MNRERLADLRKLKGRRVAAVRFSTERTDVDDNLTVPPGTEGTVGYVDDFGTLHVDWDNGRSIGILDGLDSYRLLGSS